MPEWLKDQQRLRQAEADAQSKRARQKAEADRVDRVGDKVWDKRRQKWVYG